MHLGVSSYAFGWAVGVAGHPPPTPMTELDLLDYARAQGLGLVQFGDHVPLHTFDAPRLERLRLHATAGSNPIELEIGARGLTRPHLARFIELAGTLRAGLLRFVADGPDYEPSAAEITTILREAAPVLESAGLTLGLENHDRFPARTLRTLMEEVDSPHIGICLDTANSLGAGEGIGEVMAQLAPFTVNWHIKDFAVSRLSHSMGFLVDGRPAGSGQLDLPGLRDRLESFGRCRSAVLETWTPPGETLAATLAKERRWTDQGLAFLKTLFA